MAIAWSNTSSKVMTGSPLTPPVAFWPPGCPPCSTLWRTSRRSVRAHALLKVRPALGCFCRYRFTDVPLKVCQYFCVHAFEFSQIAVGEQAIFFRGCRCDAHLCQQTI